MRKLLFIMMGLLCSMWTFGQVNFQDIKILDACEKAKQENKQVFVFVYSTWYKPSLIMFDKVFTDQKVAGWMNERFVSLKYDYDGGAKSDLRRLSNEYGINTVPISFIFNADGELENRVMIGHSEPDAWLKLLKNAMKVSLSDYAHKFDKGNRNVNFLSDYLKRLLNVSLYNNTTKEVSTALFQNLTEKQRTSSRYWFMFKDLTLSPVGSEYLEYVLSHFDAFCKGVGEDSVKNVISTAYKAKLCKVLVLQDKLSLKDVQMIGERLKPYNLNDNEFLKIARHEIKINLEEIIQSAARILDNKGRFAMVHRPDRMIEIINIMQKYDIEPKRIRFVYPKIGKDSHIFLIEGMYKGNKGLKIESPLYAHNDDGSYTNEIRKMFGEDINE